MVEGDGTGGIVGQKSYSYDLGNKLLQEVGCKKIWDYYYSIN